MTESSTEKKWYIKTKEACFPDDIFISDVAFLMLFAPHCIACNSNYGKSNNLERKSGAPAIDKKPTPKDIWARQYDLLKKCSDSFVNLKLYENTIKTRTTELADEIVKKNIANSDLNFANKNTSYKKHNYLHLYFHAVDCTQQDVFEKIIKLYAHIFSTIYENDLSAMSKTLATLAERAKERIPNYEVDASLPLCVQMAKYTAALLLLEACENEFDEQFFALKNSLLGVDMPQSASTKSIPTIESVTLKTDQYLKMCYAFLRFNPDYSDLYMVIQQLVYVRKKSNGLLDGEFGILSQELEKAIIAHGEKAHKSITQWPGTPEQRQAVIDAEKLLDMYTRWVK